VRPFRVVAIAALIAVVVSVAVPGNAGSRVPTRDAGIDSSAFQAVGLDSLSGTAVTSALTLDSTFRSAGAIDDDLALRDPAIATAPIPRDGLSVPAAPRIVVESWRWDSELSWYGPGFYGQHTACGQILTTSLLGVANRTLPCGTLISFKNPVNGRTITVPVVDRGPYVSGRQWDLTGATCAALDHCWTGPMYWHYG
jgi:hypothetical protein